MTSSASWIEEISIKDLEQKTNEIYERLRREAPLAYIPALEAYVASTWELCQEIARSDDFEGVLNPSGIRTFGRPCIIDENGPLHRDLRSMIDPALHATEVDRWVDALVRPIARRYIGIMEDVGHAELMAEYFEPVSVRSLGDFLGLTAVSSDTLRDWFHRLSASVANTGVNAGGSFSDPDGFADGDKAKEEIRALVDPLLDRWTKHPDNNSAISHWLHDGMPAGTTRSREDIYPTLFVFLLGAMQEPGHAMGSTVAGLFTRPEQLDAVIDNPQLIRRAIAEGLRWVAPIWSAAGRITVRATTIGGVDLPPGTVVMLSLGSANRDGDRYEAPSAYDMTRPPLPHLAFGAGNHGCAGIHFANHVCRIGLEELFEAIPNVAPADETRFWGWSFRGPTAVHAKWEV
jgi:aromatic O-demethylase, cytochrome P450 subunit